MRAMHRSRLGFGARRRPARGGHRGHRRRAAASQQATKASPKITVGFLQILGASPAAQRNETQFKRAAKVLGWKVNVVDAQGDPAKMASGIQSFVTQKVDAIVTIAVAPASSSRRSRLRRRRASRRSRSRARTRTRTSSMRRRSRRTTVPSARSAPSICATRSGRAPRSWPSSSRRSTRSSGVTRSPRPSSATAASRSSPHTRSTSRTRSQDSTKSTLDMLRAHPDGDGRLGRPGLRVRGRRQRRQPARYEQEGEGVRLPRRRRDARHPAQGRCPAVSLADANYNPCAWIAADQLLQFFGSKKPIDPNAQYNVYPINTVS